MSTNVNLLGKGLKYLAILIFLFIASPITLTMGFKALNKFENTDNAYISYVLISVAVCLIIFTIYFAFKTFKILLAALFDNSSTK
ncbi:hypothetical protein FDT66_13680 [Polaribacter aestuariivivens]|uniref:Uncharacterized protein n=1 Tax=Polaribacter aestuariivivens TaxID=2304626 RepID=A0A5S3N5C8_9FLAO|nr:DUF6095 family protein [Polaribacter aestuariivivens]TMM28649.1 hypothetical protein FDT66_13680 [Polaribacter aestuariivivens]